MRKHCISWLISLAAFNSTAIVLGQVQTAAPPSPAMPATVAANPAALAATAPAASQPAALPPLPPADRSGIAPASLPAVKNVMEHPQPWQQSLQRVIDRIGDPQLRQQLSEGLGGLAPQIARGLIDHRGDTAYATVAVYRQPGETGQQAAVAVAFEGFGGRLDGTFYGRVLADMPRPPDAADSAAPNGLVLDTSASCYLCFVLTGDRLCAGAVPHETFKQELAAAFQQAGKTPPNVVADEPAIQEAAVNEWLDQTVRQGVVQQQQAQLAAEQAQSASATYGPSYDDAVVAAEAYPPYYYGDYGLYGLGWYNPIIILPHRPQHHDGDSHHWQNWKWRPYYAKAHQEAVTAANSANVTPQVISVNASSPPMPEGQAVSPSGAPSGPSPQEPVFREPVRGPVQPAAPPRSAGAPSGGTRSSGGASSGSHAAGSSGGASHGGGAGRK
jgi:uncharacterized membrane protein YgcG